MQKRRGWVIALLALAACGSDARENEDDDAGGAGSAPFGSCERWGGLICDRSCECGDDGECAYGVDGFMVHFDSRGECEALIDAGCDRAPTPSAEVSAYWASCSDALETAECVAATSSEPGHVSWPEACQDGPQDE